MVKMLKTNLVKERSKIGDNSVQMIILFKIIYTMSHNNWWIISGGGGHAYKRLDAQGAKITPTPAFLKWGW